MKRLTLIPAMIGLSVASIAVPAFAQREHAEGRERSHQQRRGGENNKKAADEAGDIDKLFDLVRQARADVEALRETAGVRREERGEHSEGRREGRGEHAEGRREARGEHGEGRREGRSEHGEGRGESRGGEEGGKRIGKNQIWNQARNGAHLFLSYNAETQSFEGTVRNTTSKILKDVRVEVHLSNGVELGPTKRVDLKPGERVPVELSAANQKFTWWTTHPEHGSEEGHGPGHEGGEREGGGEHGEADESRPKDPALRPLYNELLLLRQEIKLLANGLGASGDRERRR